MTGRCDRCLISFEHPLFGFGIGAFVLLEAFLECGVHVHFVRVDDLGLLFQVKCLFVATSMGVFGGEFFLVVTDSAFGVRVADEVVHAPALPSDMCITCWQLLNYTRRYEQLIMKDK